ncbi:LysE family translocator [Microtetraspora fusca]|uniref:LysE family translocator n=1 Tax=Microtetraspora fusca TaxID=1997 RepID=UPI000834D7C7|nr:LysE family translocator [Microtetraspora fusca]
MWGILAPYLGLCLLITVTPGLDTAVVVRSTVKGGTRSGLATALGCALGLFVHAAAVALGLAELLLRSQTVFDAVRLTGAAFLVVLGARSLWAARRAQPVMAPEEAPGRLGRLLPGSPLAQGFVTNLTNPKAALFFLATLPQFVPAGRPAVAVPVALGLAIIAVLFSLTGLSLVAVALGRARRLLDSPAFRRMQDGLLGLTLVTLGVRVAAE